MNGSMSEEKKKEGAEIERGIERKTEREREREQCIRPPPPHPPIFSFFFENVLKTGEMLKMLKI